MNLVKTLSLSVLALAINVHATELVEFKTGDVATAEAFNSNNAVLNEKIDANKGDIEASQANIEVNKTAIDNLNTNIESLISTAYTPYFIEDNEGNKVGDIIVPETEGSAGVIIDAEQMYAELSLSSGRTYVEGSAYFAELDCQGQVYEAMTEDFYFSRIAKNGILTSYDELDNSIHFVSSDNAEAYNIEIKSYGNSSNCSNFDEANIRTRKVFIPQVKPVSDGLIIRCDTNNTAPDCQKSLYLNYQEPYFFKR